MLACIHLGRVLSLKGEFGRASEVLARAHAAAREWNLSMQMPGLTALLGFALARAGRCDHGAFLLQEATARLEPGTPAFLNVAVELGEAFTLLDRVDDALSCARHALDSGRACGERPYEASALRLLGEIGLAADPRRG